LSLSSSSNSISSTLSVASSSSSLTTSILSNSSEVMRLSSHEDKKLSMTSRPSLSCSSSSSSLSSSSRRSTHSNIRVDSTTAKAERKSSQWELIHWLIFSIVILAILYLAIIVFIPSGSSPSDLNFNSRSKSLSSSYTNNNDNFYSDWIKVPKAYDLDTCPFYPNIPHTSSTLTKIRPKSSLSSSSSLTKYSWLTIFEVLALVSILLWLSNKFIKPWFSKCFGKIRKRFASNEEVSDAGLNWFATHPQKYSYSQNQE